MAAFVYNISKNACTDYTLFELNCGYHPRIFFKDKYDAHSKSFSANRLITKLREKMNVYC